MAEQQQTGVDPAICRHGLWPSSQLVDGAFGNLLEVYCHALEELAAQLQVVEEAAARGQGASELVGIATGTGSSVESRLARDGLLADEEVRELRELRAAWLRQLRLLVHRAEADLGKRTPLKGPRDVQGRLRIVSS